MKTGSTADLTRFLGEFITEEKKAGIEKVLSQRTRFITVVLEDIFQPHNASAVIRSCDCFGIQDLHVIENRNEYTLNPNVAQGAGKWVTIRRYNQAFSNNTVQCLNQLRQAGYQLCATSPHNTNTDLEALDIEKKVALMFGTELSGLSEEALGQANRIVKIPMYGFTESYNLSVSVALCLQEMVKKLHRSTANWQLSDQEKAAIRLTWYRKTVKNADILERNYRAHEH